MPKLGAYWFSRIFVWGLTWSCALLALAGVFASFASNNVFPGIDPVGLCIGPFALVIVFSILCVNVMASAIMHAISRPGSWKTWHRPTLIPAIISMFIYVFASNMGMHLGWSALTGAHDAALPSDFVVNAIFFFLSCAKPLSMLAISGRESMDRDRVDEKERIEMARADRAADLEREHRREVKLAKIESQKSANHETKPRVTPPPTDQPQPPDSHNGAKSKFSLELRKQAVKLLSQGLTPLEVHKRTGIPYSTLKRQAWELKNGKVPRFAR